MNKYPNYSETRRDQFLHDYNDRGMTRWFGFYLSDHSAALRHKKQQEAYLHAQFHHQKMNFSTIATEISRALVKNYQIKVEKNTTEVIDGELIDSPPITGTITGFTEQGIVIKQQELKFSEIKGVYVIERTTN